MLSVKKNRATTALGIALGCMTMLSPQAAFSQTANSPNQITGNWSVVANNTIFPGGSSALRITQATNNVLSGSIFGDPIAGYYIPAVRRIIFVRKNSSNLPFQLYEGWVSNSGSSLAGEFHVWNTVDVASPSGVDFNFSATKTSNTP